MSVQRIPLNAWSAERDGDTANLRIGNLRIQQLIWYIFISFIEQSLILPQALMSINTGDQEHPVLWVYKGHFFMASFGAGYNEIEAAARNRSSHYNPKYTTWWDRISTKSRIAMEYIHRSSIGLPISQALLNRYYRGGQTSPSNTVAITKQIKASRYIPQWVKLEVANRDGVFCRECGCTDTKILEYDHLTSYADGGASDDPNNIGLRCLPCNRRKGRKSEVRS